MAYRTTTGPTWEPLTLEDAKTMLRVDGAEEDAFIGALISAAREWSEKYTGRLFSLVTIEQYWDCWPCAGCRCLELAVEPVAEVESVEYYDQNNALQTLDEANYYVDTVSSPARVVRSEALSSWPSLREVRPNVVKTTYTAGYADAESVPAAAKQAMRLMIAHWFENREDMEVSETNNPRIRAAQSLLSGFRVY